MTPSKPTVSQSVPRRIAGLASLAIEPVLAAAAQVARALPPIRGRGIIAQHASKFMAARTGNWSITMRRGHVLQVPRSSMQTWTAAFTGRYEEEEVELIGRFIESNTVVLDIGACFGFYAIPLGIEAKRRGARVVTFEPVPANFAVLENNVRANGLVDTVVNLEIGLGGHDSTSAMLVERGGAGNAIVLSEEVENLRCGMDSLDVCIRALDNVQWPDLCRNRRCSLVKIDVEGAEMDVLSGGQILFATQRPVIFGEFNVYFFEKYKLQPNVVQVWADENAYVCFELRPIRRGILSERHHIRLRRLNRYSSRSSASLVLVPREHPAMSDLSWTSLILE